MAEQNPDIIPYGDCAYLVRFKTKGFSRDICEFLQALRREFTPKDGWIESVAAYDSLLVSFDPMSFDPLMAERQIRKTLEKFKPQKSDSGRVIEIPVQYGGAFGPDMANIQKSSGLSQREIIQRHSEIEYLVCMMGFVPGFTFLSETDPDLHHDRHITPREHVPAGSVGIAGWQTGIYGLDSPGGWQIIGQTHLKLFDKTRNDPFLVKAGDHIRFVPFKAGS